MILDNPEITKGLARELCIDYWNPGRTREWLDMGIDIIIARREGYYFYDMDGNRYLNVHLNGGTFNLGHRNPELIEAMVTGAEEFDIGNHHFPSVIRGLLAKRLNEVTPENLKYSIFSSCGGEAVDVAIKAVRNATGKRRIISMENCYHGSTGLAMMVSHPLYREPFLCDAHPDEYVQVPLNDLAAMERELKRGDAAAVIMETIPATYGFPIPAAGYLKSVKELCEKYGALYIADEVQTGLMRTGKMWGVEHEGFEPDVIVTGKGFGGGIYPIAATIMSERAGQWTVTDGRRHISTFGGSELGCAVALRVLDITTRADTAENVAFLTEYLGRGIGALREKYGGFLVKYTQRGIIFGLEFDMPEGGRIVMETLARHGVWAIFARLNPRILQLKVGLLADTAFCDDLLTRMDAAIGEVYGNGVR
jgi:acetylornithine/succinyldiaminopimelate/putrescine aminotransferase